MTTVATSPTLIVKPWAPSFSTSGKMTDITKEQEIRVRILPQLESFSDKLWDDESVPRRFPRILDRVTRELNDLLNQE
jgi:hypothetical protein